MNCARNVAGIITGSYIRITRFIAPADIEDDDIVTVNDLRRVVGVFVQLADFVLRDVVDNFRRNIEVVVLVFYDLGFAAVDQLRRVICRDIVRGEAVILNECICNGLCVGIIRVIDDDFLVRRESGVLDCLRLIVRNGGALVLVWRHRIRDSSCRIADRVLEVAASLCIAERPALIGIRASGIDENRVVRRTIHCSFYISIRSRSVRRYGRIGRVRIIYRYVDLAGVILAAYLVYGELLIPDFETYSCITVIGKCVAFQLQIVI